LNIIKINKHGKIHRNCNRTNTKLFELDPDNYMNFYFCTNGYSNYIKFEDHILWSDDDDDREFIDDIDDYEDLTEFIIKKYNNYIHTLNSLKL
jgi:hypothetical protein